MTVLAPRILRGFTLVANDDINLAAIIEEMSLPVLEETTETFQPGGADGEIDIAGLGTKALVCAFKTKGNAPQLNTLFAGPAGTRHDWTGKKLVVDDLTGEEFEHAIDIKARLTKIDAGAAAGGKGNSYDYELKSIITYTEMWAGQVLHRFNLMTGGWDIQNGQPVGTRRRGFLFS